MCAITPYNNYFLQNTKIAGNHLPVGSIFGLLILVFLVNLPLRKLMRNGRFAFSALELTVVWMMLIVAVGIPSMGLLQFLLPSLVALRYFATTENDWAETLHPHVPEWLVVTDSRAVTDFYEGISPGESVPWMIWFKPLLVWGLFVLVFYFTTLCLSTILRKQWVERERFSFPLIQIPVQLAAEPARGHASQYFFQKQTPLGRDGTTSGVAPYQRVACAFPTGARDPAYLQYLYRLHRKAVAYTWMVARDAVRHLFFCHRDSLFTHA